MARTIAEIVARIGADTEGASRGLHAVQENLRQLQEIAGRAEPGEVQAPEEDLSFEEDEEDEDEG